MSYISTRGDAPAIGFADAMITGLAPDGGLYVPQTWPRLDVASLRGMPYSAVATASMTPFTHPDIDAVTLARLVADASAAFDRRAVVPLVQLDHGLWLMELFHGPTLAFKDVALQLLGRLFDHVLAQRGQRVTVIGATSGDTGSAAIAALRDRAAVDVFILHPQGRTSAVQRRQMTTVLADNVHNIAIEGTFDDCQDLVKAMFADAALRTELNVTAINSINWARIMAQTAYYLWAGVALGAPDRPLRFVVPTGNFGNIYAAYCARAMGLPVDRLAVATNSNDILFRFFDTGRMEIGTVVPTLSPSMDIQVSSNFERLLFDVLDRQPAALAAAMRGFRLGTPIALEGERLDGLRRLFSAARVDDAETVDTIARVHAETGMLVDPHTAVGLAAARRLFAGREAGVPVVCLACAHPAKFPDAVEQATGIRPPLPDRLADLFDRPERLTTLPNDAGRLAAFVRAHARASQGAV